jgi:hypothetical protein
MLGMGTKGNGKTSTKKKNEEMFLPQKHSFVDLTSYENLVFQPIPLKSAIKDPSLDVNRTSLQLINSNKNKSVLRNQAQSKFTKAVRGIKNE